MISCQNLSLRFANRMIFQDFNMEIKKGEHVCIGGTSGKGKSTLLRILQGSQHVDEGKIVVGDQTLGKTTIGTIRDRIAWIPQNIHLPIRNGLELLELMKLEPSEKVGQYLSSLGLDISYLSADFSDMSGGQKQRIIIAICLSMDKPIVLLDEPTAALDEAAIQLLINLISSLQKTVVSASHNITWLNSADRIIQL